MTYTQCLVCIIGSDHISEDVKKAIRSNPDTIRKLKSIKERNLEMRTWRGSVEELEAWCRQADRQEKLNKLL